MPTKPAAGTTLNTAHPLAQGMLSCLPILETATGNGTTKDLVTGANVAIAFRPNDGEIAGWYGGEQDIAAYATVNGQLYPSFTIATRCKLNSLDNQNTTLFAVTSPNNSAQYILLRITNGHTGWNAFFHDSSDNVYSSSSVTAGVFFDAVLTWDGTIFTLYQNGVQVATYAATSNNASAYYDGPAHLKSFVNPENTGSDPATSFSYFYGRALSPSEVSALHTDPYQMLGTPPQGGGGGGAQPAALTIGAVKSDGTTATQVMLSLTAAPAGGTPPLTGSYFRLAYRAGLTPLIVCTEGVAIAGNPDRTLTDTPPNGDLYAYVYQVTDSGAGSNQQVARTPIFTRQVAAVMAGGGTLSQIDLENIVQAITNSQAINSSSRLAAIAASVGEVQTTSSALQTGLSAVQTTTSATQTAVGAVQTKVNTLPVAAQIAAAVPTAADFVTALKADAQWQQVVSQVVKIYGAEWGGLIKQTDGSYNVLGVNGTNVIGNVHVVYDAAGKPTSTTKTVS